MARRRSTLLGSKSVFVLCLLTSFACKPKESSGTAESDAARTDEPRAKKRSNECLAKRPPPDAWVRKALPLTPPPVVELVDAGKEPKQTLRYRLVEGRRTGMTIRSGESGLSASSEVMVRASCTGGASLLELLLGNLAPKGYRLYIELSGRGELTAAFVDLSPELAATFSADGNYDPPTSHTFIFPSEPVGLGAKWKSVTREATFVETTEFELLERKGDELRIRGSSSQTLTPDAPPERLTLTSEHTVEVRLDDPFWQGRVVGSAADERIGLDVGFTRFPVEDRCTSACAKEGKCIQDLDGSCVVDGDSSCWHSQACVRSKRCRYDGGACVE
jgi:hypothetical protein